MILRSHCDRLTNSRNENVCTSFHSIELCCPHSIIKICADCTGFVCLAVGAHESLVRMKASSVFGKALAVDMALNERTFSVKVRDEVRPEKEFFNLSRHAALLDGTSLCGHNSTSSVEEATDPV